MNIFKRRQKTEQEPAQEPDYETLLEVLEGLGEQRAELLNPQTGKVFIEKGARSVISGRESVEALREGIEAGGDVAEAIQRIQRTPARIEDNLIEIRSDSGNWVPYARLTNEEQGLYPVTTDGDFPGTLSQYDLVSTLYRQPEATWNLLCPYAATGECDNPDCPIEAGPATYLDIQHFLGALVYNGIRTAPGPTAPVRWDGNLAYVPFGDTYRPLMRLLSPGDVTLTDDELVSAVVAAFSAANPLETMILEMLREASLEPETVS